MDRVDYVSCLATTIQDGYLHGHRLLTCVDTREEREKRKANPSHSFQISVIFVFVVPVEVNRNPTGEDRKPLFFSCFAHYLEESFTINIYHTPITSIHFYLVITHYPTRKGTKSLRSSFETRISAHRKSTLRPTIQQRLVLDKRRNILLTPEQPFLQQAWPTVVNDDKNSTWPTPYSPHNLSTTKAKMRSTTILVVALTTLASGVNGVRAAANLCFFPGGVQSLDVPCDPKAEVSMCCGSVNACLSNGLCKLEDTSNNTGIAYARGTCSDPTWQSPICPQNCVLSES